MILDEIIANKRVELKECKKRLPLSLLENRVKEVNEPLDVLTLHKQFSGVKIIAEIKKASPSKGIIREDFNHLAIAKDYSESGAFALSVLTDKKFFKGDLNYLSDIRDVTSIPLLRKDFTIDPYNIYESRLHGADLILLIVTALEPVLLSELLALTESLGMNALVEVHTEKEVETALAAGSKIIGINNRDLKTFNVSLEVSKKLSALIPDDRIVIAESGISSREDIDTLKQYGIDTFLVGETFMKASSPGEKLKKLLQ